MSNQPHTDIPPEGHRARIRDAIRMHQAEQSARQASARPRRETSGPRGNAFAFEGRIPLPLMPLADSLAGRTEFLASEFQHLEGAEFVNSAYVAILGRRADSAGMSWYSAQLANGAMSKQEVLAQLGASDEGRRRARVWGLDPAWSGTVAAADPWLRGADSPTLMLGGRVGRLPLVGRAMVILRSIWQLPARLRALSERVVEHDKVLARTSEMATRTAALAMSAEQASRVLKTHAQALETLAVKLGGAVPATQLQKFEGEVRGALANAVARDEWARSRAEDDARMAKEGSERIAAVVALREMARETTELARETALAATSVSGRLVKVETTLQAMEDATRIDEGFYYAFEDRFRGPRAEVKEKGRVYVDAVRKAVADTAKPVVDIGCGRGEWLELLGEEGIAAIGVDSNDIMVRDCTSRALNVRRGDALGFLRDAGDASFGAITALHVIEHIPIAQLLVFLDETLRVLAPDGIAIFETPNPENLTVGACNFYFDPTHERPLPPESTKAMLELRGFVDVSIMRLHPHPPEEHLRAADPAVGQTLNAVLNSAQDYAVIGRKGKK